jgi:ADP-dependent NAD(P)H-hydrate dehydratase / NAD(P)H-hydrate epimerase
MTYVLTPEQMRAVDAAAGASDSGDALMMHAGKRIAERLRAMLPHGGRVAAFAGPGNNGGDAFAAFAELPGEFEPVVYAAPATRAGGARAAAEKRARGAGVVVHPLPAGEDAARAALADAGVSVDALFGTGARSPMPPNYVPLARALDGRERRVLAIDVPSGIDALTGAVEADAVRASVTVTLGAAKPGLLLDPARDFVGELWYAAIGIPDALLGEQRRTFAMLDDDAMLALLPRRAATADKRVAGAPLIVAGSAQFPGAAILCATAAARAGAGYVTVAAPVAIANVLRAHLVEQVVVEIPDGADASAVVEYLLGIAQHNGSVAIGPGLGLDDRTGEIVREFLRRCELPVVVDASALFHLAKQLDVLAGKRCVVTPHAGEFARLSGLGTIKPGERVARAREFVDRTGIVTLLKGRDTLVDDATTTNVNVTGTNALATAGSGDVLSGIIATLLAQGLEPVDAARGGAYWHGLAGQVAAARRPVGVMAGDVIDALAEALYDPANTRQSFRRHTSLWRIF